MKLLPVLAGVSMGKLFPNGKPNGDDSVSVDESGMAKIALNANANFFGISSNILWVSFYLNQWCFYWVKNFHVTRFHVRKF